VSEVRGAPAGFWRRYAAWSLDWTLLGALLALVALPLLARARSQFLVLDQQLQDWMYERLMAAGATATSPLAMAQELLADPALAATMTAGMGQVLATLAQVALIAFGASALYFVASEASAWQATPGKRLLRLRVRAADGGEAGFGRALVRHLAGAISWMLLNLGHAIAGWRRDRRALHDLIAGTQVIADGPMPGWARAWLGLQLALLVGLLFGLLAWFGWQLYQLATM
jgi:uncharacterized RDD family membrane protein YckC